jgi:hypothetical protein
MYDSIAISIILLFLSGVFLICVIATGMPLFMNRNNVGDLMPIAMKGVRVSIVLAAICGLLELVSPGSVIRDNGIDITTAGLFLWSCALYFLLKYRGRSLQA